MDVLNKFYILRDKMQEIADRPCQHEGDQQGKDCFEADSVQCIPCQAKHILRSIMEPHTIRDIAIDTLKDLEAKP